MAWPRLRNIFYIPSTKLDLMIVTKPWYRYVESSSVTVCLLNRFLLLLGLAHLTSKHAMQMKWNEVTCDRR